MTINRRRFLQISITAAGGIAFTACNTDSSESEAVTTVGEGSGSTIASETTTQSSPAVESTIAGPPTSGGTIRVAALAAPADTMNPATVTGIMDYIAMFHIYDSLVLLQGGELSNQLAESIEPNADATVWTLVLKDGPLFHDGTPVTATDVAYSLNLIGASPNYAQFFALIDLANMQVVDDLTLVLPLNTPRGDLVETVLSQLSFVVPDGFTDWGNNIGSGPFRLSSYEPGIGATLERNPDYWGATPLLDTVEVIGIADPAARLNALKSGDIDYATGIPAAGAASEASNSDIEIRRGGPANSTMRCFAMNVKIAPFDNPDVVLACKLAIDRQAMIDVVLFGEGLLGNDMPSKNMPGYNDDVPQIERDVDRARQLFADAGVTEFTIKAADFIAGVVASAELYAQQLSEAGVTVTVDKADPTTYFDDFATVLSTPCQGFYFINRPAITHVGSYTGSAAAFNVTGFGTPEFDAALAAAQATPDADERTAQVQALLATIHDEDGFIVWAFEEQLDASRPGIDGVQGTQSVPLFWEATIS